MPYVVFKIVVFNHLRKNVLHRDLMMRLSGKKIDLNLKNKKISFALIHILCENTPRVTSSKNASFMQIICMKKKKHIWCV